MRRERVSAASDPHTRRKKRAQASETHSRNRGERITHAEKEASAASEFYTRRKQASESRTRRKKRATRTRRKKRATHTRRKKRANHTDEKRGRREISSNRVFRTLKAKLCQSVPIPAHPCRSGPLYTILCHPCRSGAFYAIPCPAVSIRAIRAIPCQAVSIRAIRAKLCQSEQSVPSCVNPTDITPRGLCRVLPAQCLARRSSPAALRRRLSSATPSQLCDATSAPRHHLSSATPSAFPTGKRRYLCRKHLWQRCTRQRMIAVIGCIVCARRSLFPVAPADIATDRAICSGLWRWS